ncbi:hypothetical protein ASC97_29175 [Rhizobium sp. Root1203]|nr:hypothetical protein ASC97_29175 [Rhizobium sp. Root1203]
MSDKVHTIDGPKAASGLAFWLGANGFKAALFMSGCAALAYQVAWQRALSQIIGSDAVSTVLVVTIFMICLGLGSELARILVKSGERRALKLYAAIEIVVALYGFLSIPIIRGVNASIGTSDSLTAGFLLNLGLLSIPIIGMGLTTPLIVHVAKESLSNVGRVAGGLYGWNIAGAAFGALVTGLVLIELLGLSGTTWVAASLNFAAAGVAIAALSHLPLRSKNTVASGNKSASIAFNSALAAVLFGFGTLSIQILYFRVLSNYLTLSTIVFPMVLCAYLLLMAGGQWLGGMLADKYAHDLRRVVIGLFVIGAVLFMTALRMPPSWASTIGALRFTTFNGQLVDVQHTPLIGDASPVAVFVFSLLLMLPVLFWSGLFPVLFRHVISSVDAAGGGFARVYSLYTVGNVLGAFVSGMFLLPLLGTGGSAAATIVVVAAGCATLMLSGGARRKTWALLAVGAAAAALVPSNYYETFKFDRYRVTDVFEGRTGVATVVPTETFYTIVDINRTASASALKRDPGPGDQYEAWRWNHSDLMALDPQFRPKNVLVIGIGHAYLIDAMLDFPFIEKITVVDISSEIISAVKAHTEGPSKRIFSDPRVNIVVADGRRYIQSAIRRGEKYDLIQNKINEPWHAGGSNLFTREFFAEEKALLNEGGYLSTRPLVGHLSDGLHVFESAIFTGYYHVYFRNGAPLDPDRATVTTDIRNAWEAKLPGGRGREEAGRATLNVVLLNNIPPLAVTDANTDDWPTFEYYWLRQVLGTWASPRVGLGSIDLSNSSRTVPVILN